MTVPAPFRTGASLLAIAFRERQARRWIASIFSSISTPLETASAQQRRGIAITGSLLLHLCIFLFLLPAKAGLSANIGTVTGLGEVNGLGTAVTLIDASELIPSEASQAETQSVSPEETPSPSATPDISENSGDIAKPTEETLAATEPQANPIAQAIQLHSDLPSDSTAEATAGAFGQNGQSNLDLWNAIAPCWNRIADSSTLPATLKISFDATGNLAIPPEIERNLDAPITDQSLKSEAHALQALAECGAYPMARGRQNVQVVFPAPTTILSVK